MSELQHLEEEANSRSFHHSASRVNIIKRSLSGVMWLVTWLVMWLVMRK